jgi:cytidylate kinase
MAIPKQGPVIAIDGPAGTGKSSATKRLADALGFVHVDTGALYRAVAYLALQQAAKARGEAAPDVVTEGLAEIPNLTEQASEIARSVHLEFKRMVRKNPKNRIYANGKDVTPYIRTPEVSMVSSRVSAIPAVRASLVGLQRRLGCVGKTILEGRDIGTVIFPDADVKFFLTADVDERAKRRLAELEAAGADAPSFEELKRQIAERDKGDSERAIAPLKKAEDAIELDTSHMTLDQVVASMEATVRNKLGILSAQSASGGPGRAG